MKHRESANSVATGGYRDQLAASIARIEVLERENRRLSEHNRALLARIAVPGPLAQIDHMALPPEARRRVIQRRVRALRRELRAALGVRRYAASAIVAVAATASFIVIAAESVACWPLAVAMLCMGAIARSLVAHWPGFDELEDRRRKLAALKSQLDEIRVGRKVSVSSSGSDSIVPPGGFETVSKVG